LGRNYKSNKVYKDITREFKDCNRFFLGSKREFRSLDGKRLVECYGSLSLSCEKNRSVLSRSLRRVVSRSSSTIRVRLSDGSGDHYYDVTLTTPVLDITRVRRVEYIQSNVR
jgi:hypothetical protein